MSEFERQILERVAHLESEIERLKSERTADRSAVFEALPQNAVVGKDYVAYRFGCSVRAVKQGEAGTNLIPRVSERPLKFIKRDVDRVFREKKKTTKVAAAGFTAEARPVRRKSIITKKEPV